MNRRALFLAVASAFLLPLRMALFIAALATIAIIGDAISAGYFTPESKLNLSVLWSWDARTRLSGLVTAVSSQYMDNDEPNSGTKIPAYTVVDLKLARAFDWGRLALTVSNLFDQDYYTYAARSAFTSDLYSVFPLPGRTFGLTAELQTN